MVCEYRQTFEDAHLYPVKDAAYYGLVVSMEAYVPLCEEHKDWADLTYPECPLKHIAAPIGAEG